jgi:hypothetical protein
MIILASGHRAVFHHPMMTDMSGNSDTKAIVVQLLHFVPRHHRGMEIYYL